MVSGASQVTLPRIQIGDAVREALVTQVKRPGHGDVERVADQVHRADRHVVRKQGFAGRCVAAGFMRLAEQRRSLALRLLGPESDNGRTQGFGLVLRAVRRRDARHAVEPRPAVGKSAQHRTPDVVDANRFGRRRQEVRQQQARPGVARPRVARQPGDAPLAGHRVRPRHGAAPLRVCTAPDSAADSSAAMRSTPAPNTAGISGRVSLSISTRRLKAMTH